MQYVSNHTSQQKKDTRPNERNEINNLHQKLNGKKHLCSGQQLMGFCLFYVFYLECLCVKSSVWIRPFTFSCENSCWLFVMRRSKCETCEQPSPQRPHFDHTQDSLHKSSFMRFNKKRELCVHDFMNIRKLFLDPMNWTNRNLKEKKGEKDDDYDDDEYILSFATFSPAISIGLTPTKPNLKRNFYRVVQTKEAETE